MSLRGTIRRFTTGTYSVARETGASVGGLWVDGGTSTFTITASIQPVSGTSLRDMPEGQSVADSIAIWTPTELRLRTDTTAPDVVTYGGSQYRVTVANHYTIRGGFWRCYAEKITVPT